MADELNPDIIRVIFQTCLTDEKVFLKWWGLLTPKFFSGPGYQDIADFVDAYFKQYGKPPEYPTLITFFYDDSIPESKRIVYETVFEDLTAAPVGDFRFYEDQLKVFIKRRAMEQALLNADVAVQKNQFDAAVAALSTANQIATDHNLGKMFFEAGEVKARYTRRNDPTANLRRLSLNIGNLDRYLDNGVKPSTLTTLIGASGFGKSMGLIHIAKQAVMQGYTVLYLTLEMTSEEVEDRFDASLTGLQTHSLRDNSEEAYRQMTEKWSQFGSSLRIIEYPEYSLSVEDLESTMKRLDVEYKFKPDVVLVDYADLLQPPKGLEKRHALNHIYVYLHRISKLFKTSVITASQTNRAGMSRAIVQMTDLAEDISKAWSSDYIFTICQTTEEQAANQARLFIAKHRFGIKFKEIKFAQDFSRAQFAVGTTTTTRTVTPSELYIEEEGLDDGQPTTQPPLDSSTGENELGATG